MCTENICRDNKCAIRQPVICRYKDERWKFYKINKCAFKHIEMKKGVENEIKTCTDDIKSLKKEKRQTWKNVIKGKRTLRK